MVNAYSEKIKAEILKLLDMKDMTTAELRDNLYGLDSGIKRGNDRVRYYADKLAKEKKLYRLDGFQGISCVYSVKHKHWWQQEL